MATEDVDKARDTEDTVIAITYCCFYKLSKLHVHHRIVNRFNSKACNEELLWDKHIIYGR
ncbi:hypothetical protein GCM10007922_05220 [Shewanella decolorationis]|nr:hypothetical protein GCM10007922_05220 [Shewanella decolorationis]